MESAGVRLKKIRMEKGLSLEEVHKRSKIHLNILKAIEEDSLVNLNPVYIKGFLKIYCQVLGQDPREYITDYKESRSQASFAPNKDSSPANSFSQPVMAKIGSLVPRVKIKSLLKIIVVIIGIFFLFNLGKFIAAKRKEAALARKEQLTVMPVVAAAKSEKKEHAPKSQKIPQATSLRLGLHARENCYVTLKSDGKVVFQGTLRKGMSENWQAKDKMELSLNNAGVVDLEINGRQISKLGRRGEAIRNIQITKEDGLVIPR